jgi:murein DD-endopeptidase MepM/ murein hydrolase activator NlpD
MRQILKFVASLLFIAVIVLGFTYGPIWFRTAQKTVTLRQWFTDPAAHPELSLAAGNRCPGAVFLIPTDGFLGYIWGDSFYPGHHHAGLDIFGPTGLAETPVVAAYDGWLSRDPTWKSAVIIRHSQDPLVSERGQIWTYYTHMADPSGDPSYILPDFPPGTQELFVPAGTLLGYQGNYSGDPANPVGIHLHFSVVKSSESGGYLNELDINNTYDPVPYLGLVEQDGVWKCP